MTSETSVQSERQSIAFENGAGAVHMSPQCTIPSFERPRVALCRENIASRIATVAHYDRAMRIFLPHVFRMLVLMKLVVPMSLQDARCNGRLIIQWSLCLSHSVRYRHLHIDAQTNAPSHSTLHQSSITSITTSPKKAQSNPRCLEVRKPPILALRPLVGQSAKRP